MRESDENEKRRDTERGGERAGGERETRANIDIKGETYTRRAVPTYEPKEGSGGGGQG